MPEQNGAAPTPDPVSPTSRGRPAERIEMPAASLQPPPRRRPIDIDGQAWIACVSGRGAYGTGHSSLAHVEAVHFARADNPDDPRFEALLPSGRFDHLFDHELVQLFRGAREIVRATSAATPPLPRRFSLEDDLI